MNAHRDLDEQLTAFLRDGPDELPYQSFEAVRDRTEMTRQRAVIGPWRTPTMNRLLAIGLGTAGVAIVGLLFGYQLLGTPANTGTSSSPSPTVTPQALEVGPFAWFQPSTTAQSADAPPVTVTIPVSGWTYRPGSACTGGAPILSKGDYDGSDLCSDGNLPESVLLVDSSSAGVNVFAYACRWYLHPGSSTDVDVIAQYLAGQNAQDTSDPVDVTVGGYHGKMTTVRVPDDGRFTEPKPFKSCDKGIHASYMRDDGGELPTRIHQGPGQIDTYWIINVDGAVVIIDAMYRPDTPADRIAEMTAIAESATFK